MSGKYYVFEQKGEKIISKLKFRTKHNLSHRKINELCNSGSGSFQLNGETVSYYLVRRLPGERTYKTHPDAKKPGPKENTSKLIEVKQPYKIIGNLKLIYSPNTGDLIKTIAI